MNQRDSRYFFRLVGYSHQAKYYFLQNAKDYVYESPKCDILVNDFKLRDSAKWVTYPCPRIRKMASQGINSLALSVENWAKRLCPLALPSKFGQTKCGSLDLF